MTPQMTQNLPQGQLPLSDREAEPIRSILIPRGITRMPASPGYFDPHANFTGTKSRVQLDPDVVPLLPISELLPSHTQLGRFELGQRAYDADFREELPHKFDISWWAISLITRFLPGNESSLLCFGTNICYIDVHVIKIRPKDGSWNISKSLRGKTHYSKGSFLFGLMPAGGH